MLIGEYTAKLQEKNRTALPKKFRSETGDKLIITKGYEDCLIVIPYGRWERVARDIAGRPFTNNAARDTSRFILGSALEVSLDDQGRFVISQSLIDHAELDNDIVFIGLLDWIEVWNLDRWREREKFLRENGATIADKLAEIDVS